MAGLIELVEKNGKIDITGVDEIVKGDVLKIGSREEKVLDFHEATVLTENNGLEIEYCLEIDSGSGKTYLIRGANL